MRLRTARIALVLVGGYALVTLPAYLWSGYLETPLGWIAFAPFLVVYALHALGVPGMLQNDGACGWGWCAPTALGWLAAGAVCLLALWLLAMLIASAISRGRDGAR